MEYERFRETVGPEAIRYLLAKLWGIAKWVGGITVVLIGLIGTIVAILVGLKRLASHGKTDG